MGLGCKLEPKARRTRQRHGLLGNVALFCNTQLHRTPLEDTGLDHTNTVACVQTSTKQGLLKERGYLVAPKNAHGSSSCAFKSSRT